MPVVLPTYTKATLPPAGTAGSLALLTDDMRGIWVDSGVQWLSLTGQINVKDFGAKGDGRNDDTAAIQAAFDAVPSSPSPAGATVFFPQGKYIVSDTLLPKAGTVIRGASKEGASILFLPTTSNAVAVRIGEGKDRVCLEHIRVMCNGNAQRCVEVAGAQECTFRDVWFTSAIQHEGLGIWIHSSGDRGSYSGNVIACLFDNLQFGASLGELNEKNPGANVWEFFGCKFTTNTIGMTGVYATNVNIIGCRFEFNSDSGINPSASPGASLGFWMMIGNYFESNGNPPLDIKISSTCDNFTLFWNYGSGGLDYVNNSLTSHIYQ